MFDVEADTEKREKAADNMIVLSKVSFAWSNDLKGVLRIVIEKSSGWFSIKKWIVMGSIYFF